MEKTEKIINEFERFIQEYNRDIGFTSYDSEVLEGVLALLKEKKPITGETSDGYHTFNELYHHRAVLFSVIVANYPDMAWKSKKHHDGTMYDGMFIVGIETPDGQATYHYDIDPYWDMFKCRVLDNAPEWDGHTPAQAIERIGKLKAQESVKPVLDIDTWECRKCGHILENQELLGDNVLFHEQYNYCPQCGRMVKWLEEQAKDNHDYSGTLIRGLLSEW